MRANSKTRVNFWRVQCEHLISSWHRTTISAMFVAWTHRESVLLRGDRCHFRECFTLVVGNFEVKIAVASHKRKIFRRDLSDVVSLIIVKNFKHCSRLLPRILGVLFDAGFWQPEGTEIALFKSVCCRHVRNTDEELLGAQASSSEKKLSSRPF